MSIVRRVLLIAAASVATLGFSGLPAQADNTVVIGDENELYQVQVDDSFNNSFNTYDVDWHNFYHHHHGHHGHHGWLGGGHDWDGGADFDDDEDWDD